MPGLVIQNQNYVAKFKNSLCEAQYDLGVYELRVIIAAMAKVPLNGTLDSRDWVVVTLEDLEKAGCTKTATYEAISLANDKLFNRYLAFRNQEKGVAWSHKTRWIQDVAVADDGSALKLRFSQTIVEALDRKQLEQFTRIALPELQKLSSAYAIRLYLILSQFRHSPSKFVSITVDDLRGRMELGDKYATYGEFKRACIDKAIKQINKAPFTSFKVSLKDTENGCKTGRKITTLHFYLKEKTEALEGDIFDGVEPKQPTVRLSGKQVTMYADHLAYGKERSAYAAKSGYSFTTFYANLQKDGLVKRAFYSGWTCAQVASDLRRRLNDPSFATYCLPWLKQLGYNPNYRSGAEKLKHVTQV